MHFKVKNKVGAQVPTLFLLPKRRSVQSTWCRFLKTDECGFSNPRLNTVGVDTARTRPVKVGTLFATLLLLFVMITQTTGQSLTDSLTAYLRRLPTNAQVSVAVESLADSTRSFHHQADERVPSASLIKLPILIEAMERIKAGQLDPDEIHILTDSEKTGGDGILKTYSHRSRIAYRDIIRLMMIHSDNTATNILINELGMNAINQRIRSLGLAKTQLNRVMMDTAAVRQGRENYVTAREMNQLLTKIYQHQIATPALCDQMLDILKQNENRQTIPRLLPNTVVVAHKTGILSYVRGDVGIIYAPQPFVLSVLVQGVSTAEAERIISEIALMCYNHYKG
ncbi:beta-lactamase [Fibrisoma limi BUZ 3]|uniref:beta-lactamase n=2 Tax=Fibrisoma limi TaxID=663275 RepID=I2GJ30_9BACT|nr:beta-lactamase [Fibrisoma limi BUZ 3]